MLLSLSFRLPDGPYHQWWRFFLFVRTWTLVFNISTRASDTLYRVLKVMLPTMLSTVPLSNYIIDRTLGIDSTKDAFTGYVCCPGCHKVRPFHKCFERRGGQSHTKLCDATLLRNHKDRRQRVCGRPLLQQVGAHLVPFLTYVYKPVKIRLCELLSRDGFEDMCELWRRREIPTGLFGDVMDGSVWREFGSLPKQDAHGRACRDADGKEIRYPCLDVPGNYALSIFVDWFQPWKRVRYSVGVLFACILNLPRAERHKKENLFVIGIFPGGSEKNLSLNSLLEPFKDEMLELHPARGVNMTTAKCPDGRKVCAVCILAVCDLPAGKKLCGFVGHNGDKGCSRCDKTWTSRTTDIGQRTSDIGRARVDGKGESDADADDGDDDDDAVEGNEGSCASKENDGKRESKDDIAAWDENALDDLRERQSQSDGDDDEEDEKEYKRERKIERRTQKLSVDQLPRGRKGLRKWRRVYANPAVMGNKRTLQQHREYAQEWLDAKTKTEQTRIAQRHGVKWSVLLEIDYWDPTRFLVIDSLHAFWLGVCKTLLKLWRDTKWKAGSTLQVMQARLDAMRVPPDVCRLLNKWSSNMSGLTGQQIKAFVGCFSVAVLDGFLEPDEEALWIHLVVASRLLSQHAISASQIEKVTPPLSDVRCPMSDVRCPMSDVRCPIVDC
jgi:hypothetical protein